MQRLAQLILTVAVVYMAVVNLIATGWLIETHGWAWVPVVWGFVLPLLWLPFPAGLGAWALAGWATIIIALGIAYYAEEEHT